VNLKVELFGANSVRLPAGEGEHNFDSSITPGEVVDWLGLKDGDQFVVLVNGQPVAAEERYSKKISENDLLTVFPPMEGG